MELIILYLPLFILIYSFYSLPINPGFPVVKVILGHKAIPNYTLTGHNWPKFGCLLAFCLIGRIWPPNVAILAADHFGHLATLPLVIHWEVSKFY